MTGCTQWDRDLWPVIVRTTAAASLTTPACLVLVSWDFLDRRWMVLFVWIDSALSAVFAEQKWTWEMLQPQVQQSAHPLQPPSWLPTRRQSSCLFLMIVFFFCVQLFPRLTNFVLVVYNTLLWLLVKISILNASETSIQYGESHPVSPISTKIDQNRPINHV